MQQFVAATDANDLAVKWGEEVFPPGCQTCPKEFTPPQTWSIRELYIGFANVTTHFWERDHNTTFGVHKAETPHSLEPEAEKLRTTLETAYKSLGLHGLVDGVIVTQNTPATVRMLLELASPSSLPDILGNPERNPNLRAAIPPDTSNPDDLLAETPYGMISAMMLLYKPAENGKQAQRYVVVDLSALLAPTPVSMKELKSRLKLEIAQALVQHLRAKSPIVRIWDLAMRGIVLSPKAIRVARQLLGEAVTLSARYTQSAEFGNIHRHPLQETMPEALGVLYELYRKALEGDKENLRAAFHYLYYVQVKAAIIETLAKCIAEDSGASLPVGAAALVSADPSLADLFAQLQAFVLRSPCQYNREDFTEFVRDIIKRYPEVFSEINAMEQEEYQTLSLL